MEGFSNRPIEFTFTNISWEAFSLLAGVPIIHLLPTPQNRDAWRRATLQKADS